MIIAIHNTCCSTVGWQRCSRHVSKQTTDSKLKVKFLWDLSVSD